MRLESWQTINTFRRRTCLAPGLSSSSSTARVNSGRARAGMAISNAESHISTGYEADFMAGAPVVQGILAGRLMASFRSFTPAERDTLQAALGDRITTYESPWLDDLMLVFNTKQPPFDDLRVRQALSLAIDRWALADQLSNTTFLKFVGALMRPGSTLAAPEDQLLPLPGFSRDIVGSRNEARRLLAEAGHPDLTLTLVNRDVPVPYGPAADAVIEAWRAIGVTATQVKLNTKEWQSSLESGRFAVAFDFAGDYFDDPSLQLTKYVSHDLSPSNYSGSTDRFLDALYIGTGNQHRLSATRSDCPRLRETRNIGSLCRAYTLVEPHRYYIGQSQRVVNDPQPFHRPGPHGRLARALIPA